MKRTEVRTTHRRLMGAPLFLAAAFIMASTMLFAILPTAAFGEAPPAKDDPAWTIYYRPGVRFGTDDRTLYINDFLIPLYQDDKNILFNNTRFTPNDQDGWEVNVGLGYRRVLLANRLVLGANAFYDQRKMSWGTIYEQWGVGGEVMADIPMGNTNLGLTGRVNYYHPVTGSKLHIGPNGGYVDRGNGIYTFDDAWLEEPLGGVDAEVGVRVPYLSDYMETWVYGGGYHFGGKYVKDVDGYSARLEVIPTDFLRLSYEYRSDRMENDQHYGEVMVEVPFSIGNLVSGKNPFEGLGKHLSGSRGLKERLTESVRRDVDVRLVQVTNDDLAHILKKLYVIYVTSEDDIDLTIDLNTRIKGPVIFVSEAAERISVRLRDGTQERPFASIEEALAKRGDEIRDGVANTICVINDNPTEPDASMATRTWAGAGTVAYAGMLILGTGVDLSAVPKLSGLPTGYPTMSGTLILKASDIAVMGISFLIKNQSEAIRIEQFNSPSERKVPLNGIKILSNRFNVIRETGPARGIFFECLDSSDPVLDDPNYPGAPVYRSLGNESRPLVIVGNDFNIQTKNGDAAGISLRNTQYDIVAMIIGNTISVKGTDKLYGIRIENQIETLPLIVDSGIILEATDNTITIDSPADEANGIYTESTRGRIVERISNNTIRVESNNLSSGISSLGDKAQIDAFIYDNDITVKSEYAGAPSSLPQKNFGIRLKSEKTDLIGNIVKASRIAAAILKIPLKAAERVALFYEIYEKLSPSEQPKQLYADISNNKISVETNRVSSGIALSSEDCLIGYVQDNRYEDADKNIYGINVIGQDNAYGIYAEFKRNFLYGGETYFHISNNGIGALSRSKHAYGILVGTGGTLYPDLTIKTETAYADISNNYLASAVGEYKGIAGGTGAFGIYLNLEDGAVGSLESPVTIGGNTIKTKCTVNGLETDFRYESIGINVISKEGLFAEVAGNVLSGTDGGVFGSGETKGIYVESKLDDIGTAERPMKITGNKVYIEMERERFTYSNGEGIYLKAFGDAYADIENNDIGDEINAGIKIKAYDNYSACYARGIRIDGGGIFATLAKNKINILNENYVSTGVLLSSSGDIGDEDSPLLIADNLLIISGLGGYGITAGASGNLFMDIVSNPEVNVPKGITVRGRVVRGIELTSGGDMGSEERPVTISNNSINATGVDSAGKDVAFGILMKSEGALFTEILKNEDITVDLTIPGSSAADAYGIYLSSKDELGSGTSPLRIYQNRIKLTSDSDFHGTVAGIYLSSLNDGIYSFGENGKIEENEITVEVKNLWYTNGIKLDAGKDIMADVSDNKIKIRSSGKIYGINISKIVNGYYAAGARTIGLYYDPTLPPAPLVPPLPAVFSDNTIDIENLTSGDIYGFFLNAQDYLFANIDDNKMNLKGKIYTNVYAAYLRTFDKLIGNSTTPTTFLRNVGLTEGTPGAIEGSSRYLMYLQTGARGGGNTVEWYDNYLAPYQNGQPSTWSGTYPSTSGVPFYHAISHNFIIRAGGDRL